MFGEISDGVAEEIKLAESLNMPVLYYTINRTTCEFTLISVDQAEYEEGYEVDAPVEA